MEILVILMLTIAVILIVGYPLVNRDKYHDHGLSQVTPHEYSNLYAERESVFDALRDLQFEYNTGKLSQGDYDLLKTRYEMQAVQVLQQIDAVKGKSPRNDVGIRACPRCAATMSARDKFCTKCGAKL